MAPATVPSCRKGGSSRKCRPAARCSSVDSSRHQCCDCFSTRHSRGCERVSTRRGQPGLGIDILSFDAEDAAHAGDIRAHLESKGTPIAAYDYLIAAQARRRGAALVTLNTREFSRVPGLIVVDWAA